VPDAHVIAVFPTKLSAEEIEFPKIAIVNEFLRHDVILSERARRPSRLECL